MVVVCRGSLWSAHGVIIHEPQLHLRTYPITVVASMHSSFHLPFLFNPLIGYAPTL